MDLEGKLLGNRYEILEQVGNGGMATVYKAKCHVLNRFVAVKVLKDEFTTDEAFVKRFNTEAQSAASLTHPNIVSVYDVGSEGDLLHSNGINKRKNIKRNYKRRWGNILEMVCKCGNTDSICIRNST